MKVACFQFPVVQANFEDNLNQIKIGLLSKKADLIVLPELCTSGYFLSKEKWILYSSPTFWNKTIDEMTSFAGFLNTHIVFAIPKMIDNKIYNISYLINETGILGAQAKIHITDDEKITFASNPIWRINPIETDFGKIALISCFDLWDSSLFRQIKADKVGLICSPCAFGSDMSPIIAKSRALEFNTPIALSNRTGIEEIDGVYESFVGMSTIWDASGEVLTQASLETEFICSAVELLQIESLPFCKNLRQEMKWR
ncbi:carbon-nitrogen hydrolase family protein [Belliella sp. DSM 111904]|uniref:Carbon-nitrogen hydrolase family protein n=1 Tax=Belliella filtrata TaxID=2923435 RepID=A0ABS9V5V2_9BACT|nr:carbon-nitrogen hydrolase family protein [Belliella filtrata]MCH7411806.1 carbon-nitrogen hydrolase family protein [Belliella filtrata]